jgi:hypothetical protein
MVTVELEMDEFPLGAADTERAELLSKSVRERDLDHFLIEELQASPQFRDWFIGHLSDCFSPPHRTITHPDYGQPSDRFTTCVLRSG